MSRIFTQPLRGSQQCPNSAQAAPRWRAKKKTVASRVRSGSSAGILSPPAPRGSAGPAQAVSRTVQSPNAYRPANAGLFLWGEWRIEKEPQRLLRPIRDFTSLFASSAGRRSWHPACGRAWRSRRPGPAPPASWPGPRRDRTPAGSSCASRRTSRRASPSGAPRCST